MATTSRARAVTSLPSGARLEHKPCGETEETPQAVRSPVATRRATRSATAACAAASDALRQSGRKRKAINEEEPAPPPQPAAKKAKELGKASRKGRSLSTTEPVSVEDNACASPKVHADPHAQQQQQPQSWGESFDPTCTAHVVLVKNLLSLSGSRSKGQDPSPAGRQQQYQQLHQALTTCCQAGTGSSIYISGLPGTGKSFTVHRALSALAQEQQVAPVSITLNCMALADSRDVCAALVAECSQLGSKRGKLSASESACMAPSTAALGGPDAAHKALVTVLQSRAKQLGSGKGGKGRHSAPLLVVVLDEVDRLLDKGPDELYKLFMLPHTPGINIALIAVANSLDLTERMLPALKCRGLSPDFISFPAYSKSQVQTILSTTLEQLPWKVFEPAALELVARTVSGSSGDLRHAFKLCRTALDTLVEGARATAAAATAIDSAAGAGPKPEAGATGGDPAVQQPAPAAATAHATAAAPAAAAPRTTIGVKEMLPAIRSISGASGASASAVATIRALPAQQQLVLLAASYVVAGAEAASVAVRECTELGASVTSTSYAAATARRNINPFAAVAPAQAGGGGAGAGEGAQARDKAGGAGFTSPAPSGKLGTAARATPSTASRLTALSADAALRVSAKEVYDRYSALCKELFMRPVALPEFSHTCMLLSEQALIHVAGAGSGATPGTAGRGRGTMAGAVGVQTAKLSLRVLAKDVRAALQANPIYRKVIGAE